MVMHYDLAMLFEYACIGMVQLLRFEPIELDNYGCVFKELCDPRNIFEGNTTFE